MAAAPGWKYKFVQVRLSDGLEMHNESIRGRNLPFVHDPEAIALLGKISKQLASIDGALGDILDNSGIQRTPIEEEGEIC